MINNMKNVTQFAFHSGVSPEPPQCHELECMEILNSGKDISDERKARIERLCSDESGIYKISGWRFDFRPHMKRFVVKRWGSWFEHYSFPANFEREYDEDGIGNGDFEFHEITNPYKDA